MTTKLGEIPDDWEIIPLYELRDKNQRYSFTGGPFGSDLKSEHYTGSGVRVIQLQNIGEGKFIEKGRIYTSEEKADELFSSNIYPNEIILAKMAPVARCCKVPAKEKRYLMCSDGIRLSVDKIRFVNEFVFQALNSRYFRNAVEAKSSGTTRERIGLNDLKKIPLLIPPIKEQRRIADILTTLDEKIESINKQLKNTEELKKGLMQRLLTKGIGHTKFKDSKLGKIPQSWELVNLGSLGVFSKGKGLPKKELVEEGIACIRYGEIYTKHNFVVKRPYSFISEATAKNSMKLKRNDILFAGSGETIDDIGKAVVFVGEEETYAGGDIIIFSPQSKFNSIFLSYCLNSSFVIEQRRKFGQGNSVVHIYARDLTLLKIPKPAKVEQDKIATIFSIIDDKKDNLIEKKELYKTLKKGLMQQLLTGKMRLKYGN